ncbi:MAG: D-2-hydroxyacid dehydrogenase [Oligoflexales bacterium]
MKAVILDATSLGQGISFESIENQVEYLSIFDSSTPDELIERIGENDCIICNKTLLSSQLIEKCPQLRLICVTATGLNNIDLEAAERCGVTVCNVKDYAGSMVSQHAMGLILMLAHNFPYYISAAVDGTWSRAQEFCLFGQDIHELEGKVIGILGYGAIGRKLAEKAKVFGMDVVLAELPGSRYQTKGPYARIPLSKFLPQVDVLSVHCPLTPETEGLIGLTQLRLMKPSAFLINTARGGIVNEAALATALKDGLIAGAALDVLSQEPPPIEHPLIAQEIPNLIITPHNSWAGQKTRQLIVEKTAENIKLFKKNCNY